MFAGLLLALAVAYLLPAWQERFGTGIMVLWGGAIGGVLASFERFERAGAVVTRSENRVLNYAVGLGIPTVVIALFYVLLAG